MIRIGIIEDEEKYLNQLLSYLDQYQKEKKINFHISTYQRANAFLDAFNKDSFDLIFIDIVLKDSINGMDISHKIREKDKNVFLVFVTTMVQYAVNGYEVDALGYMVKPITYFPFSQILDKALSRIDKKQDIYITYINKGEMGKIPSSLITYIEVRAHQLTIHTQDNTYSTRGSLDQMEEQLKEKDFVRCNNCYLVNLMYAYQISGNMVKVGKDELQISRPKKKAFLDSLTKYCGEQ